MIWVAEKTPMIEISTLLGAGQQVYFRNELYEFMGYEYCKWKDKEYDNNRSQNCNNCHGIAKLKHIPTELIKETCHGNSSREGNFSLLSIASNFIEEEEFST